MTDVALRMEGVSHAFDGVPAVARLSLSVAAGELVSLLGPSGCGKTTVLRLAAGLEPLQEGRVMIAGREVARPGLSVPPERRGVGLVFQDYALFPHLRVIDNVAFGLHRMAPEARRRTAMAVLERVGLATLAERYPHALSGGEQQRVALARALAPRPALLLLDEPFSGLDIRLRDRVRDETLAILEGSGTATLVVTHDPEEAMYMADRVVVMREGRVLQDDTPLGLYTRPANAFIARFLSPVNCFHAVARGGKVESPLGCLRADGIGDGTRVDVLIRPEGLRLGEGTAAEVTAVHPLGHSTIVVVRLAASGTELRARIAGLAAPKPGCRVGIAVDPTQAFVFPCTGPAPSG